MTTEKILNYEDSRLLNPKLFEVYGDSTWEGIKLLDGIKEKSNYLKFVGYNLDNLESPIYIFKENKSKNHIAVKICGRYQDWDLNRNIKSLISDIDKPDFVIIDHDTNAIILAGETTDTIPLGNSEHQRKGRVVVAAKQKIPFLFKCPGSHFDDSKLSATDRAAGKRGQARYLMPYSIIFHFILSIRYKTPSLLFLQQNDQSDKALNINIDNNNEKNFYNYISLTFLSRLSDVKDSKESLEKKIFQSSINFLNSKINEKRIIDKVQIEPMISNISNNSELFFTKFIEYLHGKNNKIDGILKITNWNYKTFSNWNNSNLCSKKKPINKISWLFEKLIKKRIVESFSYQPTKSRPGIVIDTPKLIELITKNTKIKKNELIKKLNVELPTLIIPTLAYQWKDESTFKEPKKDPGTGELCSFSEFFAFNEKNEKIQNILVYIYIKSPPKGISTENSLFKAIKLYSDCLIIDDKIYELN